MNRPSFFLNTKLENWRYWLFVEQEVKPVIYFQRFDYILSLAGSSQQALAKC